MKSTVLNKLYLNHNNLIVDFLVLIIDVPINKY